VTRDDITRVAREAGFVGFDGENKCLRKFAALVAEATLEKNNMTWVANCQHLVAAEREACIDLVAMYGGPVDLEAAIRARGQG